MNLIDVEKAARFAWPALEEQEFSFGLLRYAQGVSRRANSLTVFPGADIHHDSLVDIAEQFFHERGQAAVIRILQSGDAGTHECISLDACLAQQNYRREAPTLVMSKTLGNDANAGAKPACSDREIVSDANISTDDWLQAWYEFRGSDAAELKIHRQIFAKIEGPVKLLLLKESQGNPISCAMGVINDETIGIYGVATAASCRGQGHAAALIELLQQWAFEKDASYAYLQVESANVAARGLYSKLGFSELYSYWYRIQNTEQTEAMPQGWHRLSEIGE